MMNPQQSSSNLSRMVPATSPVPQQHRASMRHSDMSPAMSISNTGVRRTPGPSPEPTEDDQMPEQKHAKAEPDGDSAPKRPKRTLKLTASQRERKRAIDREAQRSIRLKTKNYIAHLENLVQIMEQGGASSAVGQGSQIVPAQASGEHSEERARVLLTQLRQSQEEVRRLREMVVGVQRLVGGALDSAPAPDVGSKLPGGVTDKVPNSYENGGASLYSHSSDSSSPVVVEYGSLAPPSDQPRSTEVGAPGYILNSSAVQPQDHHASTSTQQQQDRFDSYGRLVCPLPEPRAPEPHAPEPADSSSLRVEGDLFHLSERAVRRALAAGFSSFANQPLDEDIIVRAVLHGWPDVEDRYLLDSAWQALQKIDQHIFRDSGVVERMAILKMLRLKLINQSQENMYSIAPLPPFFHRGSMENADAINQTPLIEYFIWPGLRAALSHNSRKYINNKFSDAFRRSFKFLWPFDISDAYVRDPMTQLYGITSEFKQRQGDLRSWTMRKEFFDGANELFSAIPIYDLSMDRGLVPAGSMSMPMVTNGDQPRRGRRAHPAAVAGRVEEQELDDSAMDPINTPRPVATTAAPSTTLPPPSSHTRVPVPIADVPLTVVPHSSEVENWLGDSDMVPQFWTTPPGMDVDYSNTTWTQGTSDYVG